MEKEMKKTINKESVYNKILLREEDIVVWKIWNITDRSHDVLLPNATLSNTHNL